MTGRGSPVFRGLAVLVGALASAAVALAQPRPPVPPPPGPAASASASGASSAPSASAPVVLAPPSAIGAPSAPAPASSAPPASSVPSSAPPGSSGAPAPGPPGTPATRDPADVTASREATAPSASSEDDRVTLGKVSLHYALEGIQVRGNLRTRDRVVLRYVPFRPGTVIDVDDPELELTRFRLLGTGFFQKVSFSLRRGSQRGAVVLVIDVVERNTVVVNDLWLGVSASADAQGAPRPLSAYAGIDVSETNLAGTGITLGGAIGLAENQLALRLRFVDPSFLGTPWMAQTTLLYSAAREFYGTRDVRYDDPYVGAEATSKFAVARYSRVGGSVGGGRDLSVTTQLWLDYRLESIFAELPLAASHRRGSEIEPLSYSLDPGRSVLSALRASLVYDSRDTPSLPTRGWHVQASGDLAMLPLGSSYAFQKVQMRASHWWSLRNRHVLRLELYGGAIGGDAPVFERFYVADLSDLLPDRLLDLNTDRRPAPNFFGTSIAEVRFGDYAAKIQGEHRIPIYRGSRSVYGIDFFSALGLYAVAEKRDITDPARGYSGLARIPVDFTFNLGLRMDTNAGGFVFALANPLGFVPVLRGRP